jgi:hypothetical protein
MHDFLPAALSLEWLALAAVQRNPGLNFVGLTGFQVLKGVTLGAGERTALRFLAAPATATGDGAYTANAEIRGTGSRGQEVVHARATIRLAERSLAADGPRLAQAHGNCGRLATAYADGGDLFHGELLRGIVEVSGCDERGITARLDAQAAPQDFLPAPLRSSWLTQPLVLDCCFQLAVLWSLERRGGPCLPSAVRRYAQFVSAFPATGCEARFVVTSQSPGRLIADVELLDQSGLLLARIEGFEATVDASLRQAFAASRLAPAVAH